VVAGETSWDALEARLHERMLASADTFLAVEVGTFERFLPDDKTLAPITVHVRVLVSEHGRRPSRQAAGRLAEHLGVDVTRTPGAHTPYHDHPHELAQTMRPFLRQVSEVRVSTPPAP
jgi:pimeloyl-ACP methyl ester carboxylesterase